MQFSSASEFDRFMREKATQGGPVARMSALPKSGYEGCAVLVFADHKAEGGVDYQCLKETPITHSLGGLATHIVYTGCGSAVEDRSEENENGEVVSQPGIFSFWAKEDAERPSSKIAIKEQSFLAAGGEIPGRYPIVCDSARTLDALVVALKNLDDPLGRIAARMIQVGASMPYCPHVVILTRALPLCWYAPTGANTSLLTTWMNVLGIESVSALDDAHRLWVRLHEHGSAHILDRKLSSSFINASDQALSSSAWANGASAIRTNAQCEAASQMFSMLEVVDENLEERSLAEGSLILGQINEVREDSVRFILVDGATRFKKRRPARITRA